MIYGCGILVRDQRGRLLIGQRVNEGTWCGGGGHIDPGESPRWAAQRELKEEFGIYAFSMQYIGKLRTPDYESHIFTADTYLGTPKADGVEMQNARWVSLEDLYKYPLFKPFEESLVLYKQYRTKFKADKE